MKDRDIAYINGYKYFLKLEKGLSENTITGYIKDIKLFLTEVDKSITEVIENDVYNYFSNLSSIGISEATLARKKSSLKSLFEHLINENIMLTIDVENLPEIRYSSPPPFVLSVDRIMKMIEIADDGSVLGKRNSILIEILYATGMRISELLNLSIHDINWTDEVIRIIGKGNKQRVVPILKKTLLRLKEYLNNERNNLKKEKETDIVFLNRYGNKLSRMGVLKILKKIAMIAGEVNFSEVSPHTFRHSYATHLVENGANLRVVQMLLGHVSINTTQIYTNINIKHLKKIHKKYHPRG